MPLLQRCESSVQASDAATVAHIANQHTEDKVAVFGRQSRPLVGSASLPTEWHDRCLTVAPEREGHVVAQAVSSPHNSLPCYAGSAEFSVYTERSARGSDAGRAALAGLIDGSERHGC